MSEDLSKMPKGLRDALNPALPQGNVRAGEVAQPAHTEPHPTQPIEPTETQPKSR